jgi:glycosyltransferase involved in cell wall biosynthesis
MSITVVICTRNRKDSLLQTLATVAPQRAPIAWDVMVVDNGSEDGTAAAVRELAERFPVPLSLVPEPRQGLSFARNRALEDAEGEFVVFLDDDVNCLPGWLAAHARAQSDAEVAATGGRIEPLLPAETLPWLRELIMSENGGPASRYDLGDEPLEFRRQRHVPLPCGANFGLRRALARRLGGFKVDLGWGRRMIPGEESELLGRVLASGGVIRYVPDAHAQHRIQSARSTPEYYRRWYRGHGRATVRANPPADVPRRLARIAEELPKIALWTCRAGWRRWRSMLDARAYGEALRKGAKAQGRLLELIGL